MDSRVPIARIQGFESLLFGLKFVTLKNPQIWHQKYVFLVGIRNPRSTYLQYISPNDLFPKPNLGVLGYTYCPNPICNNDAVRLTP